MEKIVSSLKFNRVCETVLAWELPLKLSFLGFVLSPCIPYIYRIINLAMQDIQRKVTHILVDKLGIAESEITPDANFVKDLGIDSLDYAEIVMEFEQTFDIRIPDDDAEKMQTFGQAVKYIQEKLKK